MEITRRRFLFWTGAATTAGVFGRLGFNTTPCYAYADSLKTRYSVESTTICPYCGVGCGMIVSTVNRRVINVEGDPDHPINQGALCCKGQGLFQVANNERRLSRVLYRAPGSTSWEERSWEWAVQRIAKRIKETRDANFIRQDKQGRVVNRLEAIAGLGGAALDNEECYLYGKFARALGLVYLEHQARI